VCELTGVKLNLENKKLPEDDPVQRQPDITLARKELNWKPKVELGEGLGRTIEYFQKLNFNHVNPPL
jgi:nucleoside-diphosphate-sugar epimerase